MSNLNNYIIGVDFFFDWNLIQILGLLLYLSDVITNHVNINGWFK